MKATRSRVDLEGRAWGNPGGPPPAFLGPVDLERVVSEGLAEEQLFFGRLGSQVGGSMDFHATGIEPSGRREEAGRQRPS